VLIFDLDGTISDPAVGIARSVNYALSAFGYPTVPESEIPQYIGPPLDVVFSQIIEAASPDRLRDMVLKFRERYGEIGYAENTVYVGIPEALEYLASQAIPMGICTGKRADFAERILKMFCLRDYFEFVCGGDVGIRKEDQLRGLVAEHAVGQFSVMIGDRAVDIIAAHANGLRSVGVLWGHGSALELAEAGPDRVLQSPEQLKELVSTISLTRR